MITKKEPHDGRLILGIATDVAAGKPLSLADPLPNGCPERLAAVAQRCLHIDPQHRTTLSRIIEDLISVQEVLLKQHPQRIVTQQFARKRLPSDGWLNNYSIEGCSLRKFWTSSKVVQVRVVAQI